MRTTGFSTARARGVETTENAEAALVFIAGMGYGMDMGGWLYLLIWLSFKRRRTASTLYDTPTAFVIAESEIEGT